MAKKKNQKVPKVKPVENTAELQNLEETQPSNDITVTETLEETPSKGDVIEKDLSHKNDEKLAEDIVGKKQNIFEKFRSFPLYKKLLFVTPVIIVIFGATGAGVIAFKLDSYVFPSHVSGTITDSADRPLESAKVCYGKTCADTNDHGFYKIWDLQYGKHIVKVDLEGFNTYEEQVTLKRGENVDANYVLKQAGFGGIKGRFSVEEGSFNGEELRFEWDGNTVDGILVDWDIESPEKFVVTNVPTGMHNLRISTPYYKDIVQVVEISDSVIDLGNVSLTPAGDLSYYVIDWLTQKPVENVVAKIDEQEVKSNGDGIVRLIDLTPSQSSNISFTKDGYLTKKIETIVEVGAPDFINQEVVRRGKVVYVSNRTGNQNVYVANFDGSEEKMLSDNKGNNHSPFVSSDGKKVYYLSNKEGVKGQYDSIIDLVYAVSIDGGAITKVSKTKYEDYGSIGTYFFGPMKRLYVKNLNYSVSDLYIGNIDGTGSKALYTNEGGTMYNFVMSEDGGMIIYFGYGQYDTGTYGVYLINTKDKSHKFVYASEYARPIDISGNNKTALLRVSDTAGSDLFTVGLTDGKESRITNTTTMEMNVQYTPDDKGVSYTSTRDGKTDVYIYDLASKKESKITVDGKVDSYFWSSGLIFYLSEKQLWVIDPIDPEMSKPVSEKVLLPSNEYYWD